ncbi:unnamed protein product [Cuscuta epithymum]|uniref:Uncharacterized protein n=1 Tax=Cuscuta epithymum TaxID=186058 RepID=A0AAV0EZI9_9ASTE|nr:unnamed protein product [Cuscuta epithymum]
MLLLVPFDASPTMSYIVSRRLIHPTMSYIVSRRLIRPTMSYMTYISILVHHEMSVLHHKVHNCVAQNRPFFTNGILTTQLPFSLVCEPLLLAPNLAEQRELTYAHTVCVCEELTYAHTVCV